MERGSPAALPDLIWNIFCVNLVLRRHLACMRHEAAHMLSHLIGARQTPALPTQRKIGELGAEYRQRVEVAAAEARLTAQHQAALERKQLQAALEEQRRQAAEQAAAAGAAAAAAREAAEEEAALERAHHAAELQRLREQHSSELTALQVR